MRFSAFRCVIVAVLLGSVGCGQRIDDAEPLSLKTLAREQVKRGKEWRRAWRIPGGAPKALDLGVPRVGAELRLGVLPRGSVGTTVDVAVYLGEKRLTSFAAEEPMAWTDRRIPLGKNGPVHGECRVFFQSERDFWVGPCELVGEVQSKPNVLIVLVDTLRQDHLGCYGYARDTSPNIDALGADSVLFADLVPQSSWTRPSVASLLTCCYPSTHGASDRDSVMRSGLPSLGEALRAAGYESHAFMSNGTCLPVWGVGDEFDRVLDLVETKAPNSDDADVIDPAIATLRNVAGRPWFMYVHLMGPHSPYTPPPPFDQKFRSPETPGSEHDRLVRGLLDGYDGEIAYTDHQLGRMLSELRDLGLYDDTVIVLLADHGEQFYEHGDCGHGCSLFVEELNVPLLVKLPISAHAGERCEALVECVDIGPTILEAVEAPLDARFQGRSFLRAMERQEVEERLGYASLLLETKSMYMARSKKAKFINDLAAAQKMWFDLLEDPREDHPLKEAVPEGPELERHVARVATLGAHGLNVLITAGDGRVETVTGAVRAKGLGRATLLYHEDHYEVHGNEDSVTFTVRLKEGRSFMAGADGWYDTVEQDSARLHLVLDAGAEVSLEMQADGNPVGASDVFFGGDRVNRPTDGGTFEPAQYVADLHAFDPVLLPRKFAVYVWYVPDVDTIRNDELDPELRDALRGLGYLD